MLKRTLAALAVAVLFVPFARAEEKDIVETAVTAGKFNTLVTAVKKANLVETLQGEGPFTVFAPTDEAFAKIPKATLEAVLADEEKLKKILLAHVIVGKNVMAKDAVGLVGEEVNGFELSKAGKGLKIGDAKIIKTDIECKNGVIHVIDTVLIPE